jgi:ribosomal protein S18 acetylase RimI-like enzyme
MSTGPLTAAERLRRARNAREVAELALGGVRRVIDLADADVFERKRGKPVPQVKPRDDVAVVRFDERPEAAWREIIPPYRQKPLAGFQSRGDVGYIALVDGEFAGWLWISRMTFRDPWSGLRVRLAPDEAYSHSFYVAEAFRPKGVASMLVARMLDDVEADPGIASVYCWVDRRNRKSAFVLQMGFGFSRVQKIKRLHILRRWGGQVPFSAQPRSGPMSRVGRHAEVHDIVPAL